MHLSFSNMNLKSLLAVVALALPCGLFANQTLVVDMSSLVLSHHGRVAMLETIQADMAPVRETLQQQENFLLTQRQELEKLDQEARAAVNNPLSSDAHKQNTVKRAQDAMRSFELQRMQFEEFTQQFNNVTSARVNEGVTAIYEEIGRLVRNEAAKRGATLLLDKSSNKGVVLYSADALDITEDIRAILAARAPAAKP